MKSNKVVLAFSGGLDTTYCAIYLSKIKNMEVHKKIAAALRDYGYDKWVSIEMKSTEGDTRSHILNTLEYIKKIYVQ